MNHYTYFIIYNMYIYIYIMITTYQRWFINRMPSTEFFLEAFQTFEHRNWHPRFEVTTSAPCVACVVWFPLRHREACTIHAYSESAKVVSSFVGNIGQKDSNIKDVIQHICKSDGFKLLGKLPSLRIIDRHEGTERVPPCLPNLSFTIIILFLDEGTRTLARWFVVSIHLQSLSWGCSSLRRHSQHKPNICKLLAFDTDLQVVLRWTIQIPKFEPYTEVSPSGRLR